MTNQYQQQNINLDVETAYKSFVFNPNAVQSDISFADWDQLLAVLKGLPGTKQILIPQAPPTIVIPPGVYDMTGIIISGETPFAVIEVDDVQFENLMQLSSLAVSVGATVPNTVPTFVFNDGNSHIFSCDKVVFTVGALAAFPIFDISAGSSLAINARESSFASSNAAVPVFAVAGGSTLLSPTFGGVQGNSWGGPSGSNPFAVVAAGGAFGLNLTTGDIFWAADNPAGPTVVTRSDDYEAANVADWTGVEPLNVKNALDRIAAALGPIA